ncbi:hypothetical protein TCDM_09080 [Trypanosoma cruzi Dm28c]|uniref:Uncharacterized protein n=1 Tax=Trypanosoma cruzi Dm28c TaxID=1416333 RepID=V5D6U2_TRYCR|nr:hypothetical protein TCDM_09080 [Trypanosoma cruzi Dm28c]
MRKWCSYVCMYVCMCGEGHLFCVLCFAVPPLPRFCDVIFTRLYCGTMSVPTTTPASTCTRTSFVFVFSIHMQCMYQTHKEGEEEGGCVCVAEEEEGKKKETKWEDVGWREVYKTSPQLPPPKTYIYICMYRLNCHGICGGDGRRREKKKCVCRFILLVFCLFVFISLSAFFFLLFSCCLIVCLCFCHILLHVAVCLTPPLFLVVVFFFSCNLHRYCYFDWGNTALLYRHACAYMYPHIHTCVCVSVSVWICFQRLFFFFLIFSFLFFRSSFQRPPPLIAFGPFSGPRPHTHTHTHTALPPHGEP